MSGLRFGSGGTRVSLIAGCHADEPVGPRLLRRLADRFARLPPDDPLLAGREWWIVPHANPDGEARNRAWQEDVPDGAGYDLSRYLARVIREPPGDDMEFGFPLEEGGEGEEVEGEPHPDPAGAGRPAGAPRPENRAILEWWRSAPGPFHLHASLHGMAFAAGPWLLIEPTWAERARPLRDRFRERVRELGHRLHDVERLGEKGFFRLGPGFATRPDSRHMRDHFLAAGDAATAARFRPSSMEAIRALGGDPLTLVTEVPLFVTPGVGEELGPPDPAAAEWRERIEGWRARLRPGGPDAPADAGTADAVLREAGTAGLRPVPVEDQMTLQWEAVLAGLDLVERHHAG